MINIFGKKKPITQPTVPNVYSTTQKNYSAMPTTQPTKQINSYAPPNFSSIKGGASYAPPPARPAPQPQPVTQPRPQPLPQPTATSNYLSNIQKMADQKKAMAEQQRRQQEGYIKESYGLSNKGLETAIPEYENAFNTFKTNSEAGVNDIKASGERQKSQARDYYGEANLLAAKTRNETRGQTQQTFSNLGTIDSRGEGSFQQATENADSAFNSTIQRNLKAQADKLTEIDSQVGQAERQATAAIQAEESKKNTLIQQIRLAQQQNRMDEAQTLIQAYNEAQQNILAIQEAVDGLKYQSELEKEKLTQAQQALEQEVQGLSPEFMQTGVPQTMQDFIYRSNHADMYDKITPTSQSVGNNNGKALTLVNGLINGNYGAISGAFRPGNSDLTRWVFGGGTESAAWDGLRNLLALASRGQLKGTGTVSDFEAKMLEKAALAGLDPGKQTEDQFLAGLQQLQQDLMSGGAVDDTIQTIRVKENSTGQTGTIPANEFNPSLYTRI